MRCESLVPTSDLPQENHALLPRVSSELTERGNDHDIRIVADPGSWPAVSTQVDVALIPSVASAYSYPLVECERLGLPVAASDIGAHVELRHRARLFDPASARGACRAILAAISDRPDGQDDDEPEWRSSAPESYARTISTEIDRLLRRGEPSVA